MTFSPKLSLTERSSMARTSQLCMASLACSNSDWRYDSCSRSSSFSFSQFCWERFVRSRKAAISLEFSSFSFASSVSSDDLESSSVLRLEFCSSSSSICDLVWASSSYEMGEKTLAQLPPLPPMDLVREHTASSLSRSPSWDLIVLTLSKSFWNCVSACPFLLSASSTSSCSASISVRCLDCMSSSDLRISVTSARKESRSRTRASNRSFEWSASGAGGSGSPLSCS